MKKIVLTGGGTAGHVMPNIALIPKLLREGFDIYYVGSLSGIERNLIQDQGIKYFGIKTGKFRRYADLKNFTDAFKVSAGVIEASRIIKKLNPGVVFSKGGFVSVPVVLGAALNNVSVVMHESDYTPGLANKISIPFSKKVCVTFPETLSDIPNRKAVLTGTPIRSAIVQGDRKKGLAFCGFNEKKPVLLVMGGSQGSRSINYAVREIVFKLVRDFQIVHICGKGGFDDSLKDMPGYRQYEYLNNELFDIYAACDLIVSRAGANSIHEFLALKKPNLLIPLPKKSSRGDQILNTESFVKQGFSACLYEENLKSLFPEIKNLYKDGGKYRDAMEKAPQIDGTAKVLDIIREYV